jgi:hypothetical protein
VAAVLDAAGQDGEWRPAVRRVDTVREPLAQQSELLGLLRRHPRAEVQRLYVGGPGDPGGRRLRRVAQDLLPTVGQHHGAQHLVAFDHLPPRQLQPRHVQVEAVEFLVDVDPPTPQRQRGAAADPVGPLHLRERERVVPPLRVRRDLRPAALSGVRGECLAGNSAFVAGVPRQEGHDLRLMFREGATHVRVERGAGADQHVAALKPELNPAARKPLQQFGET